MKISFLLTIVLVSRIGGIPVPTTTNQEDENAWSTASYLSHATDPRFATDDLATSDFMTTAESSSMSENNAELTRYTNVCYYLQNLQTTVAQIQTYADVVYQLNCDSSVARDDMQIYFKDTCEQYVKERVMPMTSLPDFTPVSANQEQKVLYNSMLTDLYQMKYLAGNQSSLVLQEGCRHCLRNEHVCSYTKLCENQYQDNCNDEEHNLYCKSYEGLQSTQAAADNTALLHLTMMSHSEVTSTVDPATLDIGVPHHGEHPLVWLYYTLAGTMTASQHSTHFSQVYGQLTTDNNCPDNV